MKKFLKICIIISVIVLISIIAINYYDNNFVFRDTGVVIKVNEDELAVFKPSKDDNSIGTNLHVDFSDEGDIGFKMGQEVKFYYTDRITDETGLHEVKKIKILKQQSDIEIPENFLKLYYNSKENISIEIEEFSNKGIQFKLQDMNELHYEYDFYYKVVKKNLKAEIDNEKLKNSATKSVQVVTTENTIEIPPFNPNIEYKEVWEEPKLIGSIGGYNKYVLEADSNAPVYTIIGKFDWTELYGELEEGEYELRLGAKNNTDVAMKISFTIDEIGNVTYEEPELSW